MARYLIAVSVLALLVDPLFAQARKPNIVVIVGDDMGYADVGFHGCKDIPTPHLDALAKSGTRFSNGYVSGPYCSPTRAGLLTGRYQTRFGHEFNPGGGNSGLPLSEKTMADWLKQAGYATALIGKWHLGSAPEFHPQNRGFDEFFGFLGGAHAYFSQKGASILRGKTPVMEEEYLTDAFAREAINVIERHKKEPFFLYLAFNAVHTPMHATDDRLSKFSNIQDKTRRTYAAMMFAMDEAIGKVIDKIRSAGLEDDTLIIFFSDNGGPTLPTTTVNGAQNTPLRGSKRTTLDGGIRVPFLISWKGKVPSGKVYDQPVIQLDVLPTVLRAAGIEAKAEKALDGVDLLPYLAGEKKTAPHAMLFWRFGQQMAIRSGDWMLVRYDGAVDAGKGARVSGPHLYQLAEDIGETRDLAASNQAKLQELQAAWDRWNTEMTPPLWGGGKAKK